MTPEQDETTKDFDQNHLQRIYQRLDKFEERIDKLEGKVTVATRWLERIEHRLERMEEVRAELVQALTKLQTEIAMRTGMTDKEKDIIMQLLDNEKTDKDNLAQIIVGDKGRKQERFLQIWAVLGPVIASVLTSLFARFFM